MCFACTTSSKLARAVATEALCSKNVTSLSFLDIQFLRTSSFMALMADFRVGVRNACPNDLGRVLMPLNTSGPMYAWGEPRALIGKRRPRPNLEPNRHVSGADYNAIVENNTSLS